MGVLVALASIFGLLYVNRTASASAAAGSTAGALGSTRITGSPDPSVSYDTKSPFQADPIGNTHLSIADPVFNTNGELVALPYRPSDVAYGGGITDLAGVEQDPNPAGGTGSGISAIEKLNSPGAGSPIAGGAGGRVVPESRLPLRSTFRRVEQLPVFVSRACDTGSGKLPFVPRGNTGPISRVPVSPLRPTIQIRHTGIASTAAHLTAAPNQPQKQTNVKAVPARRSFFSRSRA